VFGRRLEEPERAVQLIDRLPRSDADSRVCLKTLISCFDELSMSGSALELIGDFSLTLSSSKGEPTFETHSSVRGSSIAGGDCRQGSETSYLGVRRL
jgi:hypothetical protein